MSWNKQLHWSKRPCTECSSTAQQVRPTKIQTTNLYTTAPPFRCGFNDIQSHVILTTVSLAFTADGRHRGDLTAVTQELLSLNMLISRKPNIHTVTNRCIITGTPLCRQESFVSVSFNTDLASRGLHINFHYNIWTRSLTLSCHASVTLKKIPCWPLYPISWVQTQPKPSDSSGRKKNPQHAFLSEGK
jgi:hypothetical protein